MGKKNQYVDDYTGDVASIQKRHKKYRVLMAALCTAGIVAAGSATYVLMNPAQTMTKEGIDEMDPDEDFIVVDDEPILAEQQAAPQENYDAIPLIEEWDEDDKAPADAIPAADSVAADGTADPAALTASGEPADAPPAEEWTAENEWAGDPTYVAQDVAGGSAAVYEVSETEADNAAAAGDVTAQPDASVIDPVAPADAGAAVDPAAHQDAEADSAG